MYFKINLKVQIFFSVILFGLKNTQRRSKSFVDGWNSMSLHFQSLFNWQEYYSFSQYLFLSHYNKLVGSSFVFYQDLLSSIFFLSNQYGWWITSVPHVMTSKEEFTALPVSFCDVWLFSHCCIIDLQRPGKKRKSISKTIMA